MKTLKSLSLITAASVLLISTVHADDKTAADAAGVIKRAGQPDCVYVTDDNQEMAEAVQGARKTLDKFISAVRSPKSNQSRFSVKKPFIEGDKVEQLWVNEVSFDGRIFRGKVDNKPVDLKGVKLGDEVTVSPEEISDWMFVQKGRLVGGYTVRSMCRDMSPAQKKQFEKDTNCQLD